MAKKTVEVVVRDSFSYQVHQVSIDKGKTPVGVVEAFKPSSLEELADFIEQGHETEIHACKLYTTALAIELQAAARRAKTGGKISQADFGRLFASLSVDDKSKDWNTVNAMVNQLYNEEQSEQSEQSEQTDELDN